MAGTLKVGTITTPSGSGTITIPSGVTLSGGGLANTPAFRASLSGDQSVPSSTYTKVNWNVEDYDTDNAFSSGTFTVPSGKNGLYQINSAYMLRSTSNDVTVGSINIYKNGSQFINQYINFTGTANIRDHFIGVNTVIQLAVSDTIEIYAYIVGANPYVEVSVNGAFFNMYKIIG